MMPSLNGCSSRDQRDKNQTDILVEQRPWGSFETFTHNEKSTVKLLHIRKGKRLSLQYHLKRSEFWKVVTGKVSVTLDSSALTLSKGESITIPVGAIHRIRGVEDSTILEISSGEFDENDIIRLEDDFDRIRRTAEKKQVAKDMESSVTESGNNEAHSQVPVKPSTEMTTIADMIHSCREQENIERRLDILRKINALLPETQRLHIPSLITVHYIDYALSEIEEKVLVAS